MIESCFEILIEQISYSSTTPQKSEVVNQMLEIMLFLNIPPDIFMNSIQKGKSVQNIAKYYSKLIQTKGKLNTFNYGKE